MSEDPRATRVRKVLYVANPGSGDSDEGSEDYPRRPNGHGYPYRPQPVSVPPRQQRHAPCQPTILTTDFTLKNYNHHQPQLSPDSTGSPAADESTPPPTTPSLHVPSASVDLQPRTDNSSKPLSIPDVKPSSQYCDRALNNETTPQSMTSRKGKILQTLKAPFGSRPPRTSVDNSSPRRPRIVSTSDYIPLHLYLTFASNSRQLLQRRTLLLHHHPSPRSQLSPRLK